MKLIQNINVKSKKKGDLYRNKYLLSIALLFVLFASFFPSRILATSWAYPFVVWDGYIYVISDEYVTEIDNEIGQVTKYSDMEQYSGNFLTLIKKVLNTIRLKVLIQMKQ